MRINASGSWTVQCGNRADWNCTVSIWEWVKSYRDALAISAATTAVAAALWVIVG